MSNSITASTTPVSGLLLQDPAFNVTASWPAVVRVTSASVVIGVAATSGSSPSIYYPNINYPVVGEMEVQIFNTTLTNSTGSVTNYVTLQQSSDNATWSNIPELATQLLTCVDGGSTVGTPLGSITVLLPPTVKPYIRAIANVVISGSTTGGITGSFGINTLF